MGLKLGDKITMNILGRDITGTITSFEMLIFNRWDWIYHDDEPLCACGRSSQFYRNGLHHTRA